MQITHEEARQLIQFKTDGHLNSTNDESLNAHLKQCRDCQHYLETLQDAESTLRQTMRKQWNLNPLPLSIATVQAKSNPYSIANIFVTTRTAFIGAAFVMFAFLAWQSMSTMTSPTPSSSVPMIPTPSTYTATNTLQSGCRDITYAVQSGDTLDIIAAHFSVTKEAILTANHLSDETLRSTRELIIPLCDLTPTSTILPPTFTITPNLQTISNTPG